MNSKGIVRNVDDMGRVVLPIDFRDSVGVDRNSFVEVVSQEGGIAIKRLQTCAFCGSDKDLIPFRGKRVCRSCVDMIKHKNNTL